MYAPGTQMEKLNLNTGDPVLLANHGLIALGRDLADAMAVATEVESLCQQYLIARQSGTPVLLSAEEMNQVIQRFKTYGRHAASIE
jgi:L-fuculose-phosphate aldolase